MHDLPPVGSENWTYHHALEHLKAPVAKMRRDHARFCRAPATSPVFLKGQEAADFVGERLQYLQGWADIAAPLICEQLTEAWSSSNRSISPDEIKDACADYCELMESLIHWEQKVAAAHDPTGLWTEVFTRLRGATSEWFEQLAYLPDYLEGVLNEAQGGGKKLTLNFKTPAVFNQQLTELVKNASSASQPFWQRRPYATGALAGALVWLSGL